MGKKCDLCGGVARMYCESDQASLCWDCDGKVHGANFLVAKHTRCLLCSTCQSLTPWKATGRRLAPTFSVCDSCVALESSAGGSSDQETNASGAESYDDDEDEGEYSDEDEDDEAENQVVPWADPTPVMSSSSSHGDLVAKRTRDCSDEENGCSSSDYSRPLKRPSMDESTVVINFVIRLEEEKRTFNAAVDSSSFLIRRDLSR